MLFDAQGKRHGLTAAVNQHSIYSNPNKQKDKFGALVSTWLRCRPRWAPAHRRPPPCPALTIIASFCLPDYLDCYNNLLVGFRKKGKNYGVSRRFSFDRVENAWRIISEEKWCDVADFDH